MRLSSRVDSDHNCVEVFHKQERVGTEALLELSRPPSRRAVGSRLLQLHLQSADSDGVVGPPARQRVRAGVLVHRQWVRIEVITRRLHDVSGGLRGVQSLLPNDLLCLP